MNFRMTPNFKTFALAHRNLKHHRYFLIDSIFAHETSLSRSFKIQRTTGVERTLTRSTESILVLFIARQMVS